METSRKDLIEIIEKRSVRDGEKVKLPCAVAFKIAEQYGVKIAEIGALCNEQNIRISQCQLGCFQ